MIRVLVADDHVAVRRGLRQILAAEVDIEVAGEAASAEEVRARMAEAPAQVVVLDYNMPGVHGFALLEELRRRWPQAAVLVLSMHPEGELGMAALRAGAAGYIGKDAPPEALAAAVRRVAAGGRYISDALATRVALDVAQGKPLGDETLSAREREILRLIAAGAAPKEICFKLKLSRNTVGTYRARLLKKLGVRTNAELIRFALERHLLD